MNDPRTDWNRDAIAALCDLPFDELKVRAQTVHRAHRAAGEVQLCAPLSIETGGGPKDRDMPAIVEMVKGMRPMTTDGSMRRAAQ